MTGITVLTSSYSMFLKDKQIEALANQTFKDFEWVVVDGNYEHNKDITAPFQFVHIPPKIKYEYFALAASFNDGLVRAQGKYIFFMNDYVTPDKDCLMRHWEVQERMGGCMLSGRDEYVEGISAMQGGKNVILRDFRMAMLETDSFPTKSIGDGLYEVGRDGVQNWWAGHNDSCPTETLLACNGFDEVFDGCWGGQDAEMANRLMTYGLKYFIDKKSLCISHPHQRGGGKLNVRSEDAQRALQTRVINPKVEAKVYLANTEWFVMLPRDIRGEWNGHNRNGHNS